jgi:hypothetical protein
MAKTKAPSIQYVRCSFSEIVSLFYRQKYFMTLLRAGLDLRVSP